VRTAEPKTTTQTVQVFQILIQSIHHIAMANHCNELGNCYRLDSQVLPYTIWAQSPEHQESLQFSNSAKLGDLLHQLSPSGLVLVVVLHHAAVFFLFFPHFHCEFNLSLEKLLLALKRLISVDTGNNVEFHWSKLRQNMHWICFGNFRQKLQSEYGMP
jgi:hypothetical protein